MPSPKSQRDRNVIRLLPEHRARIQRLLLLKEHHERLAREQQAEVEQLLTIAYCVNLAAESWELDEQRGLLTRLPDPQPAPLYTGIPADETPDQE